MDSVVADAEGTPPAPHPFHAFQPAFWTWGAPCPHTEAVLRAPHRGVCCLLQTDRLLLGELRNTLRMKGNLTIYV
eukprot:SAG25_NODE_112_length_14924_cov_13.606476_11_plen_75_part_00